MIVNAEHQKKEGPVEFISYSGKYPNLCSGVLRLEVNGKEYTFGMYQDYEMFWRSGGKCGFKNAYEDSYTEHNEWIIETSDLPEELQQYDAVIDKIFNDNVRHGCCGGCL